MTMYDIIGKKKQGLTLTEEEIQFFVKGFTEGAIPDYQAAALLMAICLKGCTPEETLALTLAMAASGDQLDVSSVKGETADKHSTGGVGDKTSLITIPLAAALGVRIAKMSGRGLGHTGGTVDKLEAIPGFQTALTAEAFLNQINRIGLAIVGQSGNLTPADKKIYALRDVTATVDSMPLIASSIMSKKLAGGNKNIVLDVKFGSGAFMKNPEDTKGLAEAMRDIGKRAGRNMTAVISNMDRPLGRAVGNAIEVQEAIDTLKGQGPEDLTELSVTLAALMAASALKKPYEDMVSAAKEALADGTALAIFRRMVEAQGGDPTFIDHPEQFPKAPVAKVLLSPSFGYLSAMDTEAVGKTALLLGAGRETKDTEIDLAAGLWLHKKTGDFVEKGEPLATFLCKDEALLSAAKETYVSALSFSETPPKTLPLILEILQ